MPPLLSSHALEARVNASPWLQLAAKRRALRAPSAPAPARPAEGLEDSSGTSAGSRAMVFTRRGAAAQEALFTALAEGRGEDAVRVLQAPGVPRSALTLDQAGNINALHWAAAVACSDSAALAALLAAGAALNALVPPSAAPPALLLAGMGLGAPWLRPLVDQHLSSAARAALLPGMTPLAVACRLGHIECVEELLNLGADPNAAGPVPQGIPKPFTPLSAVVLSSDGAGGAPMPAAARIAQLLLAAGADPLGHSSRRRCSTLRCACGSEFLPNRTLPLLLDHLEGRLAEGRLAFGSGDAAAEVMVGAARCCRLRLFQVAHEFVVAAAGLRTPPSAARASAAAGASGSGHRPIPSSSTEEEDATTSDDETGAGSDGSNAWLGRLARGAPPGYQPSPQQLFEVLRSAALGGSVEILRAILRSPLPFDVAATDAVGKGLMAHSATHAGSGAAVALLHRAGARLDLQRLLYVLEKTASPGPVEALLACEQPQVPLDSPTIKAGGILSFTCPIHRLLHIHKRGTQAAAAPSLEAWERRAVPLLEALLAAGYRPAVYRGMRQPTFVVERGVTVPVPDPFDPFQFFHASSATDRRLLLVARGEAWSPARHADWPEAFKAAVCCLLLAAHRQPAVDNASVAQSAARRRRGKAARLAGPAAASSAGLSSLPQELLLKIAGLAAVPMSAWL
ncbi:hypothetical protein ABPG75_012254 [Micractinium tetrahymenae]